MMIKNLKSIRWKKLFAAIATTLGLAMLGTTTEAALPATVIDKGIFDGGIIKVTGIADVYGDGEKVAAAVVQYPREINPKSVSPDDFRVEGKTIEAVFVNDKPAITKKSVVGAYVILKFKHENTAFDGELSKRPARNDQSDRIDRGNDQNKRGGDAPMRSDRKLPDLSFSVEQIGTIKAADNTTVYYPTMKIIDSVETKCPIIERFQQLEYTSPTGVKMPYNLFLPRNYTSEKDYPLVVFIPDASANINDATTPLFQGNGATCFATAAAQRQHECIVVAPQYTADLVDQLGMMTTDNHVWTPGLELVSGLIFDVINRFSVDETRIYGTGQSQGGMANIAISDRYPDLFAAQLLVACQWDVDEMAALKDKNLWIVVCEGDTKAFPGMNAAVDRWTSLGSNVARNDPFWNSKASVADLNAQIKAMSMRGANINYSVFAGGNHMYTWSFAYNLDALRDWLFDHSLPKEPVKPSVDFELISQ